MDDTDKALIDALGRNARASITELAQTLGLARSTVQTRLDRLERSGVIAGYTLRLGTAAAPQIRATILLEVSPRSAASVVARLKSIPEVERAHTCSGRFDLILQVAAANTPALDQALDRIGAIPGVTDSETLIHLSTRIDRAI